MTDSNMYPLDFVDVYCIGLGNQFTNFLLPDLCRHKNIRIRAICDTNQDKFEHVTSKLNCDAHCHTSVDEIVNYARTSSVPARSMFIVSTPPDQHFDPASKALVSGFHVYCDKPLTPKIDTATRLVELATRSNVGLVVGAQRRFEEVFIEFLALAQDAGRIQRIHAHSHGNFKCVNPNNRENDIPNGIGYHIIDVVCWLAAELNKQPVSKTVIGGTLRRSTLNKNHHAALECLIAMEFKHGLVPASIAASSLAPVDCVDELIIFSGTKAEVQYRRTRAPRDQIPGVILSIANDSSGNIRLSQSTPIGVANRAAPLLCLVDAIRRGDLQYLKSTGSDSVITLALVHEILRESQEIND